MNTENTMNATDHLFYGLGEVIYAIALSDGAIQKEEEEILGKIVREHIEKHQFEIDYTSIIFKILQKDKIFTSAEMYQNGMHQIWLGSNHLTATLRTDFKTIITQIAQAFPPVTREEKEILENFSRDIDKLS